MEISKFPPVAEVKGRLLARTEPEKAAAQLVELQARPEGLRREELSYVAGIVRGLRDLHRCLACGCVMDHPADRRRGVGEQCWEDGFRPMALPVDLDEFRPPVDELAGEGRNPSAQLELS